MITLQHTLITLIGLRGNEEELREEIPYVLLPDAIRRYCGPRQYSHFETTHDGKDISWIKYPENTTDLSKEKVGILPKHIAKEIKPCALGEKTSIDAFTYHNTHLSPRKFAGIKKHLIQDFIFDDFIRKHIDCSRMYEDKFIFNGQEYDGKGIRKVIADIENHGTYVLAYMLHKAYGITANQNWFDENVKSVLDEKYSEDLANGTYQYMQIPEVINSRISNGDWTHLEEGPLPLKEYLLMYKEVTPELAVIDYKRRTEEFYGRTPDALKKMRLKEINVHEMQKIKELSEQGD